MVVFVGPGLVAFEQLAACLQREGVECRWIGYPFSAPRRLRARLFTPVSTASTPDELVARLRDIGPDRILDIIASEYVMRDVFTASKLVTLRPELATELDRRSQWLDKHFTMEQLAAAGVRVPRQSSRGDAEGIVGELGLPVMVKGRVGNGGASVRKCATVQEVSAALEELAGDGGCYAEEFVQGTDGLCYAAAYRPDGQIIADGCYVGVRSAASEAELGELGPLDELETLEDPALTRTGEQVVRSIGGFGVMNLDAIRTASGELVVLDVNQRPWGAMVALRAAGTDFVAAWLAAHHGTPAPRQTVPGGRRVTVFSTTAINQGFRAPLRGLQEFSGAARTYAPWTGRGYIAAEWIRATAVVARHWSRKAASAVKYRHQQDR